VRKQLRRADELAAEGKTWRGDRRRAQRWAAKLYNWRRAYGGMDTDARRDSQGPVNPSEHASTCSGSKLGDFRFQFGARRDQPFRPDLR
jgi:hypothetical protein